MNGSGSLTKSTNIKKSFAFRNAGFTIGELNSKLQESVFIGNYYKDIDHHTSSIRGIVLTSDEQYIISVGEDKKICVFKTKTQELVKEFPSSHDGNSAPICEIAIDAEGNYFATCAEDMTVSVFDVKHLKHQYTIQIPEYGGSCCLAMTSNGGKLIVGTESGNLYVILRENKQILHKFENVHDDAIKEVILTKNERFVYSASADKTVGVFDLLELKKTDSLDFIHTNTILAIKLIKSDKILISCSVDKTITFTDIAKKQVIKRFDHTFSVIAECLMVTHDEKYTLAGGHGGNLCIYDNEKLQHIQTFEKIHEGWIAAIAVSKNFQRIVTGGSDGIILVIDFGPEESLSYKLDQYQRWVNCVAVTPTKKNLIAVGSKDRTITLYAKDRTRVHQFTEAHSGGTSALCFARDSSVLYSGGEDGSVSSWNVDNFCLEFMISSVHEKRINSIETTNEESLIMTASLDGKVSIINAKERVVIHTFSPLNEQITAAAFANTGTWFAVCGIKGALRVWDFEDREEIGIFDGFQAESKLVLAITANDKYLLSAGTDKSIAVINVESKTLYHKFMDAHQDWILALTTSSCGRYAFSASTDKSIGIFNIIDKVFIHRYTHVHRDSIVCLKLTEDERDIITGSKDKTVHLTKNFVNITEVTVSSKSLFFINDAREGRLFMNKMVAKLITDFILKKEVARACELIKAYPDLAIVPYGINNFHIASSIEANSPAYISQCIESKIKFTVDFNGQTPLHYLLNSALKDFPRIDSLLSESESLFTQSQSSDELLLRFSDIFFKILKMNNSNAASFLQKCVVPAHPKVASLIPSYGRIKNNSKLCIKLSGTPQPTKENLKDVLSKLDEDGTSNIHISYLRIPLNFNPFSLQLLRLIKLLTILDSEELFNTKAIKWLIGYCWDASKKYIWLYTGFYTISILIFSVYAALGERYLALEIIDFAIMVYFIIYEIHQIVTGKAVYFQDLWNLNDLLTFTLRPITYILIWCDTSDEVRSWLVAFSLLHGYLKWISCFRLFDSTRRIVRMLMEIINDLRSFFLIVIFIIVGFSLIFNQFSMDNGLTYGQQLLRTYEVMYGEFDTSSYEAGEIFFFIVITVLLSVIMLNMIIAMMSDTFGRVQSKRVLFESKEKCLLIMEVFSVQRMLRRIFCAKRLKRMDKAAPQYLFVIEENIDENNELDTKMEVELACVQKKIEKSLGFRSKWKKNRKASNSSCLR